MTIDEALFAYLTDPGTETGYIIGSRLYPLTLPQAPTYEAATYQQITSELTATGQSAPGDLEDAFIQFDCYGLRKTLAKALAKALRADLSGFKGDLAGINATIYFQNEYDFWEPEAGVWRVTLEFKILFNI